MGTLSGTDGNLAYRNAVYDTVLTRWVRWVSLNSPDTAGTYYPGTVGNWKANSYKIEMVTPWQQLGNAFPAWQEIPTPPAATGRTWTVGASGCDYTTLAAAISGASAGDRLLLNPETFPDITSTVTINKTLWIEGSGTTVLQTSNDGAAPVTFISVTANNVVLKNLIIKQRKTTNTSVEVAIAAGADGSPICNFHVLDCRIETMEFGLSLRCGNSTTSKTGFVISNCELAYNGAAANTHRLIATYSHFPTTYTDDSQSFIADNRVFCSSDASPGRTIFMLMSSSADTTYGRINIYRNTQAAGNLRQFCTDEVPATSDCLLDVRGNSFTDLNSCLALYEGGSSNVIVRGVILLDNSFANTAGKGVLAFDGLNTGKSIPATFAVWAARNTITNGSITASGFASATAPDTGLIGYATAVYNAISITPIDFA